MRRITYKRVNGFRIQVIGNWLTGYRVKYQGVISGTKTRSRLQAYRWCALLNKFIRGEKYKPRIVSMKFSHRGQDYWMSYSPCTDEEYNFSFFM